MGYFTALKQTIRRLKRSLSKCGSHKHLITLALWPSQTIWMEGRVHVCVHERVCVVLLTPKNTDRVKREITVWPPTVKQQLLKTVNSHSQNIYKTQDMNKTTVHTLKINKGWMSWCVYQVNINGQNKTNCLWGGGIWKMDGSQWQLTIWQSFYLE